MNAIRTGVRPDGSVILPPMPWPMYATMTDDDAYAIAAYLKAGFVDSGEVSPGGRAGTQQLMLCDLHATGMGH